MALTTKTPAETVGDLLEMDNSNSGITASTRAIKSGNGTASALSISDRAIKVTANTDSTATVNVINSTATTLFNIDSSNSQVKALGNHVNTQYANFNIGYSQSTGFTAGSHEMIPFESANYGYFSASIPNLGTGTDPATTFTTSNSTAEKAGDLVPCLWYVPDNIVIDGVYSLEGADTSTGDTTRMHLVSFAFESGATACLTSGTLLAFNSDVTNAGSEQPYLSTWTIDSSSVASGRVIVATFESDSINADYSLNIKIKYHLSI